MPARASPAPLPLELDPPTTPAPTKPTARAEIIERIGEAREAAGSIRVWSRADFEAFTKSPAARLGHTIARLQSLVVQALIRSITNTHSKEDAAQILFARHRYGYGSGELRDYLQGMPGLKVVPQQALPTVQIVSQRSEADVLAVLRRLQEKQPTSFGQATLKHWSLWLQNSGAVRVAAQVFLPSLPRK